MMLYLGRLPNRKSVEQLILSGTLLRASLGLSVYVYEAMMMKGDHKDFVIRDIETRWGMMLRKGSDTFWETERGAADFGGAGALCQGWSSIPLYLFGRYSL